MLSIDFLSVIRLYERCADLITNFTRQTAHHVGCLWQTTLQILISHVIGIIKDLCLIPKH